MKKVVLSSLEADGSMLYLKEAPPDEQALATTTQFTVTLNIDGKDIELDLTKLRQFKRLLNDGERQLLLRQEQAMRARNMKLDF